jgi:hypothetical protein
MDKQPNYLVEQQRLRSQIAAQIATIERQKLEVLELVDRKLRHEENIEAACQAINDMQAQLNSLANAHGVLNDQAYHSLSALIPGG